MEESKHDKPLNRVKLVNKTDNGDVTVPVKSEEKVVGTESPIDEAIPNNVSENKEKSIVGQRSNVKSQRNSPQRITTNKPFIRTSSRFSRLKNTDNISLPRKVNSKISRGRFSVSYIKPYLLFASLL